MHFFLSVAIAIGIATPALSEVVPISSVQRGQTATVEGVVDRFFDSDEIRLRDESGAVRVYLGPQMIDLKSGERIRVSGILDNDLLLNEFYAREITRENGESISIRHQYE
ncbi:hypothetical protein GCM10007385_46310 [Tateyamaria omphalii]|uniref:hypothetical protein n=1 Tax=Tateyamaria omphalii TaxID=299262 RepID=UPI00167A736F|nr:hypothetical protein [Tateyamaria omphalii]GGX72214.1 hypothetical protein GCM10007385_46310 [Tateyamaria omphalii]